MASPVAALSAEPGLGGTYGGDDRLLNGVLDGLNHCGQCLAFGPRGLELLRQGLAFPPTRLEIGPWR